MCLQNVCPPGVHEEARNHPGDNRNHLDLQVRNGLQDAAGHVKTIYGAQRDAVSL